MKLFVTSMPKSGTYLAVEFFRVLGFHYTGLHLAQKTYIDYSKADLHSSTYHPETLRVNVPLWKSLRLINENAFACGHIGPKKINRLLLRRFNVVFLQREVRSALVSYFKFFKETGRQNAKNKKWYHIDSPVQSFSGFLEEQGDYRIRMYRNLANWVNISSVNILRFEWLISKDATNILSFLKRTIHDIDISTHYIEYLLDSVHTKKTITKSSNSSGLNFNNCWSEDAEYFFQQHGGPNINSLLGYIN